MSDLAPTPTWLALLADVDTTNVYRAMSGDTYWWCAGAGKGSPRKVTAQIAELETAGWVKLGPTRWGHIADWHKTDLGRAVLDQHRRAESPAVEDLDAEARQAAAWGDTCDAEQRDVHGATRRAET